MPIEKDPLPDQSPAITRLKQRVRGVETEEGRKMGLRYQPRSNDVLLAACPKCGTTWTQQICHELRWSYAQLKAAREGFVDEENKNDQDELLLVDMLKDKPLEFREITEVIPWIEAAADCGQNLQDEQPYGDDVRVLKTHLWAVHSPGPFPKTIVVIRDPVPVLPSFYRFFENWFFPAGEIPLEEFGLQFWLQRGFPDNEMQNAGYFAYLISWYKQFVKRVIDEENPSSMIFVFYEDLIENHEREVTRLARFLSTETVDFCTPAIIRLVMERSSFQFMKKNEGFFDEKLLKIARNEACGLAPDAGMYHGKISQGENSKNRQVMTEPVLKEIERQWNEVIQAEAGIATYEDLRQQFRRWRDEGKSM